MVLLIEVQVDIVRVCYLLGKPELPCVDGAGGFLLEVELNGLTMHDGGAEHVGELLLAFTIFITSLVFQLHVMRVRLLARWILPWPL